ncbi:MAG: hypothetical protein ABIP03_14160, partial [Aquihabitans sp.]
DWLFPVAIVVIVLLGAGIVIFARNQNGGSGDSDTPPKAGLSEGQAADHWHAAFSINVCGKEQPNLADVKEDLLGIHSHQDGLIHIHPFSIRSAGKGATLGRYFDMIGLEVTNDAFKVPGTKEVFRAGETKCSGKPTELVVAYWKNSVGAAGSKPTKVYTKDFANIRFTQDLSAFSLALVPKGTKTFQIPLSSAGINNPKDVTGETPGSQFPTGNPATATAPEVPTTAPAGATTPPTTPPTTAGSGG